MKEPNASMNTHHTSLILRASATALLTVALFQSGCSKSSEIGGSGSSAPNKTVISVQGSDTMVNEAQAWAEAYAKAVPEVSVEVGGGGSGVGIAALIAGTIDIANASRDMKPAEKAKAKERQGVDPIEFTVGYDALAIYVHKDNPMNEISLEQLDAIYADAGATTKWSQLGQKVPGCDKDDIIRVSRQSSSGTYEFFREHVLANSDFKLGSIDMNGSMEVVDLVANTPCAIGYSGMGYATDQVKMLKISLKTGGPSFPPSVENTLNKTYAIARPLFVYTLGEPKGHVKDYINWILGAEGQRIVEESGYVPVPVGGVK